MSLLEESRFSASIADNVRKIREGVREAALRVGRDPSTVQLVAATKTVSTSLLIEAYEAQKAKIYFLEHEISDTRQGR